ncbi:ParB N-terminal domain-containing protein [Nocardioides sp. W3-2-3]|uniref:ParB/RepB/Spo0J family partition protein n=1 Tax=Nocardioides convexus TaxID=2712224 RepID=UPI0024183FB0|nr:ParB N-terminal domain-containing protein [Nocardioides convexus]NHA02000.1 ParB N-terminal domain-containing protein [Nocardioides convexus]
MTDQHFTVDEARSVVTDALRAHIEKARRRGRPTARPGAREGDGRERHRLDAHHPGPRLRPADAGAPDRGARERGGVGSMTTDTTTSTDALVQATSGAIAVLPLEQIHPHPKNIRHNAVADDEMVESIRSQGLIQPLVVAPMPGTETGNDPGPAYRLIAGHRRLDGLRRAEATHATVIIRRDLVDEADQVAAMLVENCRRTDLTPMEEAEGYGQPALRLRLEARSDRQGRRSQRRHHQQEAQAPQGSTRRSRRPSTTGRLSLDDALAVAALPTTVQKQVSKHAGTSNFKWEVSKAKEKIAAQAKADKADRRARGPGDPEAEPRRARRGPPT